MPKVTFLGTNGWYDSKTGNTISILLEDKNFYLVLDAGNGIHKLSDYTKEDKPVFIFISHFHLDHIIGLHSLVKNRHLKEVTILIAKDHKTTFEQFVHFPYTIPVNDLPFRVNVFEVSDPNLSLPFIASFLPMEHSAFTLGIRIETSGKIITYCPDTGYCDNALLLAKDADFLITECAYRTGESHPEWPHLTPELAAKLALNSGAKKLVLTHFEAERYPDFASRWQAEKEARAIFPNAFASLDGMSFEI